MKTRLLAFAALVVTCLIGSSRPARSQLAAPNTVNSAAIIDRTIEAVDIKNPITAAGVAVPTLGVEATAPGATKRPWCSIFERARTLALQHAS